MQTSQRTNTLKNRFRAISDNGFVSMYLYDAAGERIVKQTQDFKSYEYWF